MLEGAITTPEACMEAFLLRFSSTLAYSKRFLLSIFSDSVPALKYAAKSGTSFKHSVSGLTLPNRIGISLVRSLISLNGKLRTRPTSLSTPRGASLLKVIICATESSPYFSLAY